MSSVKLPARISGKWIFLDSLRETRDTVVLMRHELDAENFSGDMTLWITANCSYQLFINGRLAGAGPRAHQMPGNHFIDIHDIGCYLEHGKNMIAVQLYTNRDPERGDTVRLPGMWCQAGNDNRTVLCSDESWELFYDPELTAPRAKVTPGGHPAGFCNLKKIPSGWNLPGADPAGWVHPDLLAEPGAEGTGLELHPLLPAAVNADRIILKEFCSGQAAVLPNWSAVSFPEKPGVYAAVSYLYSENCQKVPVVINTDRPFKFFCGKDAAAAGESAREQEVFLELKPGWNRLSLFARPRLHGMGVMLVFPAGENVSLPLCDCQSDAAQGWRIAGPLRLELEEVSPAVRVEQYAHISQNVSLDRLYDSFDWLCRCRFSRTQDSAAKLLRENDFAVYKLDTLRYGFVNLTFHASEGDIVDVLTGLGWDEEKCMPKFANGNDRQVTSCLCRNGENQLILSSPCDCFYVFFFVRRSKRGIRLVECSFDEFSCSFNRESFFKSSDPLLNRLWQTGKTALLRNCSCISPVEGRIDDDCCLLDAYLEAANISAVFCNVEYAAVRLRQFASDQLEDGSIAPLSFALRHSSSPIHMFFFPIWMLYNYRFSGNPVELRNLQPNLNALRQYMESLLNEEQNFLDPARLAPPAPEDRDPVSACRSATVVNALLCRFMLSAKEVYTQLECPAESRRCGKIAGQVAEMLNRRCYDSTRNLFADEPLSEDQNSYSFLSSFFAIQCGCRMKECFENFMNTFFDVRHAQANVQEADSPYFHFLFMEMMCSIGQREWALHYFRNYWEERLAQEGDTWLKAPGSDIVRSSGFNCGAGLVPNVFMVREILGVRVADPGHSVIFFNPAYTFCNAAEATLPTSRGRLCVKWQVQDDGGLDITIDSGFPIKVVPELSEEMLRRSIFRLGENIILLQPHREE